MVMAVDNIVQWQKQECAECVEFYHMNSMEM